MGTVYGFAALAIVLVSIPVLGRAVERGAGTGIVVLGSFAAFALAVGLGSVWGF